MTAWFAGVFLLLYALYFAGIFGAALYAFGPNRLKPELRVRVVLLSLFFWTAWLLPAFFILVAFLQSSGEMRSTWTALGYPGLGVYVLIVIVIEVFLMPQSSSQSPNGGSS